MKRWQRLRAVLPDVCSARTNLLPHGETQDSGSAEEATPERRFMDKSPRYPMI